MKKVLYVITSPSHKRCFESFTERQDLEQMIIGPAPTEIRFVPEDYSDFKIKNIQYTDKDIERSIGNYVKLYKPDIYVQPDLSDIHNIVYNSSSHKYKRVYVSHGMIGNHVKDLMKVERFNTSVWHGMDLYCGATKTFAEWIKYVAKVGDDKILLNAIPQLDILHNPEYYNSYRDRVIKKTRHPAAQKVILFMGFCCKDRHDFKAHNADYFKTAIELGKIAKRNNWLVMIKPRQTHVEIMKFLQTHKWGKKFILDYNALYCSKNVHFIGPAATHIYRYYFADAFVFNGCSTAEVEACAIQKPLFVVRTDSKCLQSGYDPYNTVSSGAAISVQDISKLEHNLMEYFNNGRCHYPEKQKELIDKMNISFDGHMYERIQNKLLEL
jgi:hypothetical protein